MNIALVILNVVLVTAVLGLAFLLTGALRLLGVLSWRVDQMEAMRPSRIGREGLKIGRRAPNFTLPSAGGGERSLSDFEGRKVLLVMTQSGCGPCMGIVPELNRLHDRGEYCVLIVNNGQLEETVRWTMDAKARFPVLIQEKFSVSKRYEVFVTPFAFVIDERGHIASKGIAGSAQYLGYVLSGAGNRPSQSETEDLAELDAKELPANDRRGETEREIDDGDCQHHNDRDHGVVPLVHSN
jgi:methylamine dehydrogenase accessory protein MauD